MLEWLADSKVAPLLREPTAEDMLGRPPAVLDSQACRAVLTNRRILVTGACGSIGSELCRQIASFQPRSLIALDNNETGLYDLDIELNAQFPGLDLRVVVGDVTDRAKVEDLFRKERPEIVFHGAAYKHVPLMQRYPEEAVRVNIGGTLTVLEAARRHPCKRFVLVSTDKAVNPSSVMGATKRIAEVLVTTAPSAQALDVSMLCTAVRFGNVLGSRGSVLPTFAKQIELGGPVTVTHPEMTRYFMEIKEAASLILQAASLTTGNDIFMLEMGEHIRIDELARKLIRMRGLRPGIDILIEYVGIRPGEKLHEELIYSEEERERTDRSLIYRVNGQNGQAAEVLSRIDEVLKMAAESRREALVETLLQLTQNGQIAHAQPEPAVPQPASG
jgi:FlaA1/EpsC-like NDP-sugar epimerase